MKFVSLYLVRFEQASHPSTLPVADASWLFPGHLNDLYELLQASYSPEHREATEAVLSGFLGQVVAGVATARRLDEKQVRGLKLSDNLGALSILPNHQTMWDLA